MLLMQFELSGLGSSQPASQLVADRPTAARFLLLAPLIRCMLRGVERGRLAERGSEGEGWRGRQGENTKTASTKSQPGLPGTGRTGWGERTGEVGREDRGTSRLTRSRLAKQKRERNGRRRSGPGLARPPPPQRPDSLRPDGVCQLLPLLLKLNANSPSDTEAAAEKSC